MKKLRKLMVVMFLLVLGLYVLIGCKIPILPTEISDEVEGLSIGGWALFKNGNEVTNSLSHGIVEIRIGETQDVYEIRFPGKNDDYLTISTENCSLCCYFCDADCARMEPIGQSEKFEFYLWGLKKSETKFSIILNKSGLEVFNSGPITIFVK